METVTASLINGRPPDYIGHLLLICFLLLQTLQYVAAIPIDNAVTATSVQCTADSITVNFQTKNPFSGRIFVKDMSDKAECRKSFTDTASTNMPTMTFSFGSCNMQRSRTLSPQKGMMQSLVVVISFHRIFVTKVDKAYRVQCFYMESEKTVSSEIDVSMLTTDDIRDTGRMPTCTYSVRRGSMTGEIVRYARVGEAVYHEWECNSENHRILVKDCYVDDGQGNKYLILNDKGCSIDPVIMQNIMYDQTGMAKAWVESHVFKFADKPTVFFQCTIQLCNRGEPACDEISPPKCSGVSSGTIIPFSGGPVPTAVFTVQPTEVPAGGSTASAAGSSVTGAGENTTSSSGTSVAVGSSASSGGSSVAGGERTTAAMSVGVVNASSASTGGSSSSASAVTVEPTSGTVNVSAVYRRNRLQRSADLQRLAQHRLLQYETVAADDGDLDLLGSTRDNELDLFSNTISVIDLVDDSYSSPQSDSVRSILPNMSPDDESLRSNRKGNVCMSTSGFGLLLSLVIVVFVIAIIIGCMLCRKNKLKAR